MSEQINLLKEKMQSSLEVYKKNISSVRAGRASPDLLNQVKIEAYGDFLPLNQLATVTVQDPTMLMVQVWDKTNVEIIEKAIRTSDLGLNPAIDGSNIRVPLPKPSEERRLELIKVCGQHAEQGRIAIRNIRRDVIDTLKKEQKEASLSEDKLHDLTAEVQKITDQFTGQIDEILENKKKEIMVI